MGRDGAKIGQDRPKMIQDSPKMALKRAMGSSNLRKNGRAGPMGRGRGGVNPSPGTGGEEVSFAKQTEAQDLHASRQSASADFPRALM